MILGIQILGVAFSLIMMYLAYNNYIKKELSTVETSFWICLWSLFGLASLFPRSLFYIARILSFARVFDFLTFAAIVFLMIITYNNHLIVKKNEKRIEKIIRRMAIEHKK